MVDTWSTTFLTYINDLETNKESVVVRGGVRHQTNSESFRFALLLNCRDLLKDVAKKVSFFMRRYVVVVLMGFTSRTVLRSNASS